MGGIPPPCRHARRRLAALASVFQVMANSSCPLLVGAAIPKRRERRDSAAPYPRQQGGQHAHDFCFGNSRDLIYHQSDKRFAVRCRHSANEESKKRSIGWIGCERAHRNGIGHVETVVFRESPPDAVFLRSPYRQKRSKSRRASLPPQSETAIDKVLVLLGVRTPGNSQGLPACLCHERGRTQCRAPISGWAVSLVDATACDVPDLIAGGLGSASCFPYLAPFLVTCNLSHALPISIVGIAATHGTRANLQPATLAAKHPVWNNVCRN